MTRDGRSRETFPLCRFVLKRGGGGNTPLSLLLEYFGKLSRAEYDEEEDLYEQREIYTFSGARSMQSTSWPLEQRTWPFIVEIFLKELDAIEEQSPDFEGAQDAREDMRSSTAHFRNSRFKHGRGTYSLPLSMSKELGVLKRRQRSGLRDPQYICSWTPEGGGAHGYWKVRFWEQTPTYVDHDLLSEMRSTPEKHYAPIESTDIVFFLFDARAEATHVLLLFAFLKSRGAHITIAYAF
jgi:hypothetical protein